MEYQRAVLEMVSTVRSSSAVAVGYRDGAPEGLRIFGHSGEVGQALTLEAGSAHLAGVAKGEPARTEQRPAEDA